jgi:hypothetical protein
VTQGKATAALGRETKERPLCRAAHEGDAEARASDVWQQGRDAEASGKKRCRARLNRSGDIGLGSNSDEDKDAAMHRAGRPGLEMQDL